MSNSEIHRVNPATERILGVILAGGKSRRFGRPKALATLGGTPMASWGMRALQAADLPVVVISDEDGVEAGLGVGCLSTICLQEAFARGSLIPLHIPQRDFSRRFSIILHRHKYRSSGLQQWLALCQSW